MKTSNLSNLAIAITAAVVFAAHAIGQTVIQQPLQPTVAAPKRVIVVSLEDRKLALVEDGQMKKVYSVAVGKPSTPSPTGTFTIERRVANPTYSHNGKTVLPGPNNPVGTRWMGLSKHGYGIHGTNEPKSIGKAASHGCIRMARTDLEEFYALVAEGDTVELIGQRNEETAQLFGNAAVPSAPAAQPVLATVTATPAPALQSAPADAASNQQPAVTVAAIVSALR
jgi:lipoprotein-anchoring transpeptidase ErfK/SrfK